MKNEITPQILGMYLGQKIEFVEDQKFFDIGSIMEVNHVVLFSIIEENASGFVLHLRPLSSLTEAEARELFKISRGEEWDYEYNSSLASRDRKMGKIWSCLQNWWAGDYEMFAENGNWLVGDPNAWLYLLSKGFDLFGGIEAGWAKEIETTTTP